MRSATKVYTYRVNIAGGSLRYSWWMVALVTPISIALAVAQAAVDKNRLAMNIIGAIVSFCANRLLNILCPLLELLQ